MWQPQQPAQGTPAAGSCRRRNPASPCLPLRVPAAPVPTAHHHCVSSTLSPSSPWPHLHLAHLCRPDGSRPEIYLKREDLNHTGAHKINNSLGQALLCKRMGKKRIIAETGAGQHGVATVSSWRCTVIHGACCCMGGGAVLPHTLPQRSAAPHSSACRRCLWQAC